MSGRESIDDETWAMILSAQKELIALLPRLARVPVEVAEDCISEGMIDLIVQFDPWQIRTDANRIGVTMDKQIFFALKNAAGRHLSRAKRQMGKLVSDDTPLGEEDEDFRLRDLFVPRANSAERIENYAEWMSFARKGGCPLTQDEIKSLFGID